MAQASEARSEIRFGIQGKLFSAFLAVALVPLMVVWLMDRSQTVAIATDAAEDGLKQTSDQIVASIDNWIDVNVKMMQLVASDPDVRAGEVRATKAKLIGIQNQLPWVNFTHVIGANGMNTVRGDNIPLTDYGDRGYFKQALATGKIASDVVISKTTKKPTLAMVVPILDDLGHPIAVLGEAAGLDDITDAILKKTIGKTGYAILTDADGKLIASPRDSGDKALVDLSQHAAVAAAKNGTLGLQHVVVDGRKVLAYGQRTRMGWICVVQQDESEVNEPIRRIDVASLVLLLVTSVIVTLLALLSARSLVRPIVFLTNVADQISRGQLEHQLLEAQRTDEIGGLARSIDRLAKSMKIAMDRLRSSR